MRTRSCCGILALLLLSGCTQTIEPTLDTADYFDAKTFFTVAETESVSASTGELPMTNVSYGSSIVYVSLGDSIARGYGLADVEAERFSTVAKEYWLAKGFSDVTVYNASVDGQDLWGVLETVIEKTDPAWAESDVISVSIGANHILSHIWSFLYTLSTDSTTNTTTLCAEFQAAVDDACAMFGAGLPMLLDNLHDMAPDAMVLLLTFYDPYTTLPTEIEVDGTVVLVNTLLGAAVQQINDCILAAAEGVQYVQVVDVHAAFAGETASLVCVDAPDVTDPHALDLNKLDPHPNATGHKRIGELVGEAYLVAQAERT